MSDSDRVPLVSSRSSSMESLTPSSRYTSIKRRIRTGLCVGGVFLGVLALSAIAVVIAVKELRNKYTQTIQVNELNRNLTWAVRFNGKVVDQVTMEVADITYVSFMSLYAFPRLPPLTVSRRYHDALGYFFLWTREISPKSMFLNAGSRIKVSFCVDWEVRVIVMQYDGVVNDVDDPRFQQYVKWQGTFVCQGDCPSNCSVNHTVFSSSEMGVYQFLFTPSNRVLNVSLTDVEFAGELMEYELATGKTDFCNTSVRSIECSVDLPRQEGAAVVIDVGNIPINPGYNLNIQVLLRSNFRQDLVGTLAGGVMGCVAALTAGVLIIWLINRNNNRDVDDDEEETTIT